MNRIFESLTSLFAGGAMGVVIGLLLCTLVFSECGPKVPTSPPSIFTAPPDLVEDSTDVSPDLRVDLPAQPLVLYRTRIVRDTVQFCADVPDDLDTEGAVVASEESVGIVRPWFRDPYVTYRYFNPETFSVEERRYVVEPPKFVYGVEAETYFQNSAHGLIPGSGAGVYAGHRNVMGFGRVQYTTDGLGYQVGVRVRLGR